MSTEPAVVLEEDYTSLRTCRLPTGVGARSRIAETEMPGLMADTQRICGPKTTCRLQASWVHST